MNRQDAQDVLCLLQWITMQRSGTGEPWRDSEAAAAGTRLAAAASEVLGVRLDPHALAENWPRTDADDLFPTQESGR